MAKFPKMPLWTDAYLADTTHLTTIEHGAYFLILMAMWRAPAQKLADDDVQLAKFTKLTRAQWARIRPSLAALCVIENGFWTSSKLVKEFNAVRQHSESQSDKARARHLKNKDGDDETAGARHQSGNAPNPNPQSKNIIKPLTPLDASMPNSVEEAKDTNEGVAKGGNGFLLAPDYQSSVEEPQEGIPVLRHGDDFDDLDAQTRVKGFSGGAGVWGRAMRPMWLHEAFPLANNAEEFAAALPAAWKECLNNHIDPAWQFAVVASFWEKWVGPVAGLMNDPKAKKQNWLWAFVHSCQVAAQQGRVINGKNLIGSHFARFFKPTVAAE